MFLMSYPNSTNCNYFCALRRYNHPGSIEGRIIPFLLFRVLAFWASILRNHRKIENDRCQQADSTAAERRRWQAHPCHGRAQRWQQGRQGQGENRIAPFEGHFAQCTCRSPVPGSVHFFRLTKKLNLGHFNRRALTLRIDRFFSLTNTVVPQLISLGSYCMKSWQRINSPTWS